jgi:hypothetical protein
MDDLNMQWVRGSCAQKTLEPMLHGGCVEQDILERNLYPNAMKRHYSDGWMRNEKHPL